MTSALDIFQDRPAPIVRSTADPEADILLLARSLMQRDEELRALFVRFRTEGKPVAWLRDMLAPRVAAQLDDQPFDAVLGACQYLADEYHQLGEGYFIVAQATGRVALVASDDDLYDPGMLTRDSGLSGQALRRLKPNLEVAFITHYHDREREQRVLATLAARAHQTDLLREDGDRRLRIASRAGRTSLARELAEDHPSALLQRSSGTAGMFLRHFPVLEANQDTSLSRFEGVACCRSILGIEDMSTLNLGYDRLGVLRTIVPQAWIRDIARQLSYHARTHHRGGVPVSIADVDEELLGSQQLWVADPDVYALLRRSTVMPVEGAETIGLRGSVGALVVASEFGVETRESADRWEVRATVPYQLYVDLEKVRFLPLVGVPRAAGLL